MRESMSKTRAELAAGAEPAAAGRLAALALGATLSLWLAGCGGTQSGRSDYVRDADTGAAAPATTLTPDRPEGPDSTAGVSERTGKRGVAGDTLGSKGAATGATNPAATGQRPPETSSAAGKGRRP
ncbi:MAG: hypothetical protein ACJ79S_08165 [Gemmatimonadaceae bacterium]